MSRSENGLNFFLTSCFLEQLRTFHAGRMRAKSSVGQLAARIAVDADFTEAINRVTMRFMKVLIQNVATGEYLTQNGKDFRGSSCARAVLRKQETSGLRAIFYFEEFDYSIKIKRPQSELLTASLCVGGMDF
jgi:hypothetical protein